MNAQLPGNVLLYGFSNIWAKSIGGGGAALEAVAEPQQVSAAKELSDFRIGLTSTESLATPGTSPRTQPVSTSRQILAYSNTSLPQGVTSEDSGELCMLGLNGGYEDEWCTRAVEGTYPSGGTMPRYLVMENDGYPGFSGTTAVQMPGLRVRPGLISSADGTLPVTDFAEQAFSIAAGTVLGQTCATVPGIALPNAAATDGVLFVKAPSTVGQLQMSGTITAANTMSLTACNPSTTAQSYPAGAYYAFLLGGAKASATPAASGGTPTATTPLTTSEGDLVVGDVNGNPSRLPGNSTTTQAVLVQSGTGAAANEPVWQTAPSFYGGNLTGLNAGNISTGAVGIGNGGTGATTATQALANLGGASLNASVSAFAGELTGKQVGGVYQVDQFAGGDIGAKLSACIAGLSTPYGGICDARNFTGPINMAASVTISTPNTTVLLPCATIATTGQFVVPAGVRNVTLKGCGLRGASAASGSQGGTVLLYSGTGAAVQVGDPTYAADTMGFHLDDVVINTTGSSSATTQGLVAYRTQELDLESLYFLGNSNQTGLVLDGTGNYTGGTFYDLEFNGFQTAVDGIGHQVANAATTDWMNASTFVRLHIDCPTSGGGPVAGTYGINLQQGDGNTFTGGDVEGCSTALHLGPNAQNNTVAGLRNENSTSQVVADQGSSYNSWVGGGTMFTGALTDNGTRNSFLDSFHRTFNGMKGDWYQSQQDATVTNHLRLGLGNGNERGLLNEYQTDFGYRWETGLGDGTSGEQFYNITDLLNNVNRLSVGQYLSAAADTVTNVIVNNGGCYSTATPPVVSFAGGGGSGAAATAVMAATSSLSCSGGYTVASVTMTAGGSGYTTQPTVAFTGTNQTSAPNAVAEITTSGGTNNQTVLNAAGTGAVVLNGSNNAGTGGVVFGSGGTAESTVATIDGSGNESLWGQLNFYPGGIEAWEVEPSTTALTIQNANATTPARVFKAYVNGGTDLDSQAAGAVTVNNTSTGGTGGLIVYGGGANYNTAELTVTGGGNVSANGFLSGRFAMGSGTMTMAANSAAGSGATMVCAAGHVCDGVSGTVTLTTGTGLTVGSLGTLSFPNSHTNDANCVVSVQLAGTGLVSSVGWSESTTSLTLTANAVLGAGTAYSVRYWCGGN